MKAFVQTQYGSPGVLKLSELPRPIPAPDEVLVQVYATSINFNNLVSVSGKPLLARMSSGFFKPNIPVPGGDIAGRVVATGSRAQQFKPGDQVFGDLSHSGFGAFAEYACVPESAIAPKPSNISFEEAAASAQASMVALQGLRKGNIQAGQQVLICGASGGIGSFAVQIAKYFGAEVTGVCSYRNLDLVKSIGADYVVDYTCEDFVNHSRRYDLILATVGYRSILDYKRALKPQGIYVATGGTMPQIFQAMLLGPLLSAAGSAKMGNMALAIRQEDLLFIKELIESGHITPVIDCCYPFSQLTQAMEYYARGHARGKVAVKVAAAN